ncbi:DUF6165 family protein [Synechococcus sp. MU1651]|uniref:DUF6165 family protein n=1 Tax=Synechococcus sp. MU1651 TaxID=2508353 RepID=UPI002026E5F2|nr:DUF6165 family protein [Synechococcus sp. MU1651]
MEVQIPVSVGELVDKIIILQIKANRFSGEALVNVQRELTLLEGVLKKCGMELPTELVKALSEINQQLWTIEDDIREREANGCFDDRFIALARSVYRCNDQRAALKRQINTATGSHLIEEKGYASY